MNIGNFAKLKLFSLSFAEALPSGSAIGGGIYSILALPMALFLPLAMVSGGGIYSVFNSVFNSVFGIANGNGNAKSAVFGNSLLQISSGTKASG